MVNRLNPVNTTIGYKYFEESLMGSRMSLLRRGTGWGFSEVLCY